MNNTKNILVLSKLSKNKNDIWTVIEYKRHRKNSSIENFQWIPEGRNLVFKTRSDAILKMSIEAVDLYETVHAHQIHAFNADFEKDFVKVV